MLNDMAQLSMKAVELAVQSFMEGQNLQDEVFQLSERLRWLQDEVSDLAVELIARYQPVARDLRFLRSAMEVAYGFSRFGRYAYDIAQIIPTFGELRDCEKRVVAEVSGVVKEMIEKSIKSFTEKRVDLASGLERMDTFVDRAYRDHVSHSANHDGSKRCDMAVMLMLRYLERIADHATYIGDSVEYIVEGVRRPRK
ncbi:MAG: phosphate uptake regulator, PhoU [Candidatus Caldarchaeum sp.]|nr:phosphate uptake regulator, PhoU [Candidatus Caldarchaeum sp.]